MKFNIFKRGSGSGQPSEVDPTAIHMKFADGFRHCDAIPRLIGMLNMSKIDDELAAPGDTFISLMLMRTHDKSTAELRGEIQNATFRLLRYFDIVTESLVGRTVSFTPETQDIAADRAWLIPRGSTPLLPEVREEFVDDSDSLRGTVGGLNFLEGVLGILPPKGSDAANRSMLMCSRVVRLGRHEGKRAVMPSGELAFADPRKIDYRLSGVEKSETINSARLRMLSSLGVKDAFDMPTEQILNSYAEQQITLDSEQKRRGLVNLR